VLKRSIIKVMVLFVIGAIMNVAVAWGSVLAIRLPMDAGVLVTPDGLVDDDSFRFGWRARVAVAPGVTRVGYWEFHFCGNESDSDPPPLHDSIPWWSERSFSIEGFRKVIPTQEARGWPMRTLWCEYEFSEASRDVRSSTSLGGITAPLPYSFFIADEYRAALPLRPIWPGTVINAIFYSMILWALFAMPGMIRRRWRVRRGRCAACGYPTGTSAVCTECGNKVNE